MGKFATEVLTLTLQEPERMVLRDFSKLFSTLNNLYNYYAVLSVPEARENLEHRMKRVPEKKVHTVLYSSALEKSIGRQNTMNVVSISKSSPTVISVEGAAPAMRALAGLLILLLPGFKIIKEAEQLKEGPQFSEIRKNLEREKSALAAEHLKIYQKYVSLLEEIETLSASDYAKTLLLRGIHRNLRSLEINQLKPLITDRSR